MIHRQTGLGRGLGAIIPPRSGAIRPATETDIGPAPAATALPSTPLGTSGGTFLQVPVSLITPNPKQPRRHFDHAALEDLVSSIKEHGIIEPLVVTRGAAAYQRLIDEFGLTQDQVSNKVGKSRPQVANTVRLLQLPADVKQALVDRKISASNARTLLSLPTESERHDLFQTMLSGNFTVRQTEARVPHPRRARAVADPNVQDAERRLRESLGHRVEIKRSPNGAGEIRVAFDNEEDLRDLTNRLS